MEQLHESLYNKKIEFIVISGKPWANEGLVDVVDELSFGRRCKNIRIVGKVYFSINAFKFLKNADLIIIEQLNASLHLYPLILFRWFDIIKSRLLRRPRRMKLAFYGHGASLNESIASKLSSGWKRFFSKQVDWWFAYTEISRKIVERLNFPSNKISVFQNATDTQALKSSSLQLSTKDLIQCEMQLFPGMLTSKFDIGTASFIGVFCSRFVASKWIPFLLKSLDYIYDKIPNFKMIFIGDGPDAVIVKEFCRSRHWSILVGPMHGIKKVKYIALADVWLNPGMVGLSIVDALALGVPIVTTHNNIHSPEIDYLRHGQNGLILDPEPLLYSEGIVDLFRKPDKLLMLKENAKKDGQKYTIEEMVYRFEKGVIDCLETN